MSREIKIIAEETFKGENQEERLKGLEELICKIIVKMESSNEGE